MMIQVFPKKPNLEVDVITFSPPFEAMCSIGKDIFKGTITIAYRPAEFLLEFASMDAWLKELTSKPTTIEELCSDVGSALLEVLIPVELTVHVEAESQVHSPASAMLSYNLERVN